MASTRLTSNHRSLLNSLVDQVVDCPAEIKAEQTAYDRALPHVRKLVEAVFAPADMKVFSRYDLSRRDKCVRAQCQDGAVQEFQFREADAPTIPSYGNCRSRMYLADARAGEAIEKWVDASKALAEATSRKRAEYYSFVANAATFEQVVEIWPEASQLAPRIKVNLPAAISPEMIERIKTDSAARLKRQKAA